MDERKIFLFTVTVIIYFLYSAHMWFMKESPVDEVKTQIEPVIEPESELIVPSPDIIQENETEVIKPKPKTKPKTIPLYFRNACSVLEIFTEKPPTKCKEKKDGTDYDNNSITVIGMTVFLVLLVLNAALDVLKVKEEERLQKKLNPDGERRQSLAEFANMKPIRRESSKFCLQLFQIPESTTKKEDEKKTYHKTRPYTRGDSTNSYLSDKRCNSESAPTSVGDTSEPKLVKRQSVAKLFGARPVPMVRRSSFPALPLNPDIQALMLGHRQPSVDSDDEGDGRGRRVRLIRRY